MVNKESKRINKKEIEKIAKDYVDDYLQLARQEINLKKIQEGGCEVLLGINTLATLICCFELSVNPDKHPEIFRQIENYVTDYYPEARKRFYESLEIPPWTEIIEEQYAPHDIIFFYWTTNPEWFARNAQFWGKYMEAERGKPYLYGILYKLGDEFYIVYNAYAPKPHPHPEHRQYTRRWFAKRAAEYKKFGGEV